MRQRRGKKIREIMSRCILDSLLSSSLVANILQIGRVVKSTASKRAHSVITKSAYISKGNITALHGPLWIAGNHLLWLQDHVGIVETSTDTWARFMIIMVNVLAGEPSS